MQYIQRYEEFLMKILALLILIFLSSNLLAVQDSNRKIEKWGFYELSLSGPAAGDPFIEIAFSAVFKHGDRTFEPDGFYDSKGVSVPKLYLLFA